MTIADVVDAKKQRFGRDDALALLDGVNRLTVAKGKNVVHVDLAADRPDDDALAKLLLGPSGNLRAPTIRRGRTMVVGFHPDAYDELVG